MQCLLHIHGFYNLFLFLKVKVNYMHDSHKKTQKGWNFNMLLFSISTIISNSKFS